MNQNKNSYPLLMVLSPCVKVLNRRVFFSLLISSRQSSPSLRKSQLTPKKGRLGFPEPLPLCSVVCATNLSALNSSQFPLRGIG